MGKKVANKQRVNSEEGKHIFPAQTLVGSSGKFILSRKLKPLRRSRSDKIREKALEQDYLDKCNALACRLKGHKHLLELILQLTCCNGDGSCNSTLCQELKARHANSITLIKFLLEKLGTTLDVLPKQTQVSLHEMLCMDKKLRAKLEKGFRFSGKLKAAHFKHGAAAAQREDTHSLEEFFQMFVHGIKDDRPLVLMLKQDELGHALWDVVQKKCRSLPSSFILLHQGRKISLGHTLKEQGLTQDCNIHIHFGLCGGMEKDKDSAPRNNGERRNKGPQKWKKVQVIQWIEEVCESYEIDEGDVSKLKTLSGAGLMKLKRQDWKERSPNQGDLFFNLWTELIAATRQDTTSTYPNSPEREANPVSVRDNDPGRAKRESPRSTSPDGKEPVTSSSYCSTQKSVSGTQGPFGTVENLDKISEKHVTVDELSKWTPTDGEVIAVKGLCSSRPRNSGGAGTVLLRNDPVDGGTFLELKVDIRVCPNSKILTKHIITTILDVKLGEPLFVRGKIERLDKGLTSMKEGFEMLPFKIVVDSDEHAAVRNEVKTTPSYLRQLSVPWPTACGIFPAEGSTQEPIFQGDILRSTRGNLYCLPSAPLEKIKESIVALKNSLTGDIFVGVSGDGKAIGVKVSRDAVVQKREDLGRALGAILPSVDERLAICTTATEANECVEKRKDFVAAMWLHNKSLPLEDDFEEAGEISILFRIHVVEGSSPVNFVKPEHTHAYVRVGAETKLMTDYEDLLHRLESLASRNIPDKSHTYINKEIDKGSMYVVSENKYHLFDRVWFETDKREFKVIFGDPKRIILKDHVKKYSASFLNSDGGDILLGIQEEQKFGYAVGVSMSEDDRKELVQESSKMICNFWPSVDSSQFLMKFIEVKCDSSKNIIRYPKTHVGSEGKFVAVNIQDNSNVLKFINYAKTKAGQLAVLRLKNNRFCILVKDVSRLNVENFLSEMVSECSKSKYFQMGVASSEEVEATKNALCVVHLHVSASPYPIHLTSPFLTFCLDQQGMVTEMKPTQLLECFTKTVYQHKPDKLLNAVNGFEKENTSYVLVCSPFCLPRQDRDLYGIVVPEWALVLDFDQSPNQEGHLLNIFKPLHDRHQVERNLFVKTPLDRRLDLNPRNGVCWCAVRGYEDIDKTLSEGGHASWMMSHGHKMRAVIDQLIHHINPNQLVVVCLWDNGCEKLFPSLDVLLQHFFSCWGPVKVIFVCSSTATKSAVLSGLVEPLERAEFGVKRDNVFVALPHEMARHVGAKLPPPYRSEDAFQIPRRFHYSDGERTIPDTLPQTIRQAIKGHLQIMYLDTGTTSQSKPDDEDNVRVKFYSGSEIDEIGLANTIAIERGKMKEFKKELKSFLTDKRSHVCLTILKAERGAGATTLCMQLLYEYHKQYVCARLLEFHDSLATNIEKITQHSRLPLILFVDSEMAHLPEFNDFKNEAERRNLNLKLLVVESDLLYSQKVTSSKKKQPIPYFVGTAPFKTVELSRELTLNEVSQLVDQFLKIKNISEEKKHKLKALKERVSRECALRKFAFFSLTVFGRLFSGLKNYVGYRLALAKELQLQILEFLAITHVYTDFLFPVNALARLAKTDAVMLEKIFSNDDVRELLSPPSSDGRNDRRISFVEVAEELLQQQAKKYELSHTLYLKDVALRLAKCALSDPRPSKRIDRITRQLYVTSEYGSEKFSPLVRYMRDNDRDVARDMLHELSDTFEKGSSVWAHLLAHLAKYYMSVYEDFLSAIPLIEEAAREHKEDVLLHHIHGDLIRLHVQNLKDQKDFSLGEVLRYAIRCSSCFEIVKEKRPLMEHGYSSDALVRKVVMLAAIKSVSGSHFVDFLKAFLEERKINQSSSTFSEEDKYIISLVPDSFANLRAVPINEHTAKLKDNLLQNLGTLDELKAFSEDLKEATKGSNDEVWVDAVVLQTMSLIYSLEIERRQLQPEEADERIKKLEELMMTQPYHDEESMKIWIRCVRLGSKVPNLKAIRGSIDRWLKATGRKSPYALFYNYVVAILEALSDPHDTEKMKRATECVKELLRKRSPRSKGVLQDPSLPVEWLHPKQGRHINSLDSLLYHEELVREYLKTTAFQGQKRAGKEIIEKALFQEKITKWEGVVDEIINDWKGTISFQKRINVSFVPVNVQPYMPNEGDEVQFCLAFNWTGPFAWYVVCPPGLAKAQKAGARSANSLPIYSEEDNVDMETSEEGDEQDLLPLVGKSLHRQIVRPQRKVKADDVEVDQWGCHLAEEMQGIIVQVLPVKGYGRIHHPNFEERLFFHAKQIVPPVDNLSSIEAYSVVSFTVGKTEKGPRAMNIKTVKEKDIDSVLRECRLKLQEEEKMKDSAASAVSQRTTRTAALPKTLDDLHNMRSRQEGHICDIKGPPNHKSVYGFIEVPSTNEKLFFQESLSGISKADIHNISVGTKVQFSVGKREKGYFAEKLFIQSPESKKASVSYAWKPEGIQEGYVAKLDINRNFGFINILNKDPLSESCLNPTRVFFHESELRAGYTFNQLVLGDRVHFILGQNEKGYFAQRIDVQGKTSLVVVSQAGFSSSFPGSHFLSEQPNIGQFSPMHYSPTRSQPNPLAGRPFQDPGGHPDGDWQSVTKRKR